MSEPVLLWFRQDLRLHDQPALVAAAQDGPVIPVFILDDDASGKWAIGAAQRWWLHHSLAALGAALHDKGSRLILRRGDGVATLRALMKETGAHRIHAVRHYEPWWRDAEDALGERLCLHDGNHLAAPTSIVTGTGTPFKVYSAFWRVLSAQMPPEKPLPVPRDIPAPARWPKNEALGSWSLLPSKPTGRRASPGTGRLAKTRHCARPGISRPRSAITPTSAICRPSRGHHDCRPISTWAKSRRDSCGMRSTAIATPASSARSWRGVISRQA